MEKRQVEILAPAGSFDSMKAAVAAGADAVYMGGSRFGARAYADNPDEKGLLEAIDYVHLHGRRLYMTVNTLFKEDELELYASILGERAGRGHSPGFGRPGLYAAAFPRTGAAFQYTDDGHQCIRSQDDEGNGMLPGGYCQGNVPGGNTPYP